MAITNVPKFYFMRRAAAIASLTTHKERWRAQEVRDQQLEYWLNNHAHSGGGGGSLDLPKFSLPGGVYLVTSGSYENVNGSDIELDGGVLNSRTTGASDVEVELTVNGSMVTTIVLTSGTTREPFSFTPELWAIGDLCFVEVTDAGAGDVEDIFIQVVGTAV